MIWPAEKTSRSMARRVFGPLIQETPDRFILVQRQPPEGIAEALPRVPVVGVPEVELKEQYAHARQFYREKLTGNYTVAIDLNLAFDPILAYFVLRSGAGMRIGFQTTEDADDFFNVLISKQSSVIEPSYMHIRRLLTSRL